MMTPARKEPDKETYSGRFAIRLRELREKAGLTPEQVASCLGVTKDTIYNWEAARTFPKPDQLPLLSESLGVRSVRMLFPEK